MIDDETRAELAREAEEEERRAWERLAEDIWNRRTEEDDGADA